MAPTAIISTTGDLIATRKRGTAVKQKLLAPVTQNAGQLHGPHHLGKNADPVDHSGVDDLPPPYRNMLINLIN